MPLWDTVLSGDKPLIVKTIQESPKEILNKPNEEGECLIHYAVKHYDENLLSQLLEAGANPNLVNADGNTALILAVRWKNSDMVSSLLKAKVDVTMRDKKGRTALMLAIKLKVYEAVRLLLEAYPPEEHIEADADESDKTVGDYIHEAGDQDIRRMFEFRGQENDHIRLIIDFEGGLTRTGYIPKHQFDGCDFSKYLAMRLIVPPDLFTEELH